MAMVQSKKHLLYRYASRYLLERGEAQTTISVPRNSGWPWPHDATSDPLYKWGITALSILGSPL